MEEAKDFLWEALKEEPQLADEVKKAAKKEGVAKRTLDRARSALAVQTLRAGFGGPCTWKLPLEMDPHTRQVEGGGWRV